MAMDLTSDSSYTIGDGSSLIWVFDIMLLRLVGSDRETIKNGRRMRLIVGTLVCRVVFYGRSDYGS
eukprot:scaffold37268_cov23-Cyclotella_meneghiniana.AAC.1